MISNDMMRRVHALDKVCIPELMPYEASGEFPTPEGPWILTYTRKKFSYTHPSVDAIDIRDIARALSLKCRYSGHLRQLYSVAQHCVLVSYLVPEEHAFWGLMHDATEAYVADIPAPLKGLLPEYRAMEKRVAAVISDKFDMSIGEPPIVKQFDRKILANEIRDLFDEDAMIHATNLLPPVEGLTIIPWTSEEAEQRFMARFLELQFN